MTTQHKKSLQDQLEDLKKTIERPNILLLGKTGSGKSTLANLVFGKGVFATGTGRPVTQGISYYSSPQLGIGVFDSKGYELGQETEDAFFKEVIGFASRSSTTCNDQSVHICWYCIPAEQERVPPIDKTWVSEIRKLGIPIAVVITKSDLLSYQSLSSFAKTVRSAMPPNTVIFKVANIEAAGAKDIPNLCEWSKSSLSIALQFAFTRAQKVKIQAKSDLAVQVVDKSCREIATMGFNAYDIALTNHIIENSRTMIAKILYIYEMEEIERYLSGLEDAVAGRNKLVGLFTYFIEKAAEFLGHLIGEGPGALVGKALGKLFSSHTQSHFSETVTRAIGVTTINICSSLADNALSGKTPPLAGC